MTYSPNIPEANNEPAQDQPLMKENFQVINTAFGVDHVGMVEVTNRGKHQWIHLPVTTVPTTPFSSTEGVIYTKTAQANSQIFYKRDGLAQEFQLTGLTSGAATNGYTFLFGGFYIEWGSATTSNAGVRTVSFSQAFSTSAYAVVATPIESDTTGSSRLIKVTSKSSTQFSVFIADRTGAAQSCTFSWIAIGAI